MKKNISHDLIQDDVVSRSLEFIEGSVILEVPTVITYPDFARSLLEESVEKGKESSIIITDEMVQRCLDYFERSLVLTIPTVATYPEFMRDLLSYAILGEIPDPESSSADSGTGGERATALGQSESFQENLS